MMVSRTTAITPLTRFALAFSCTKTHPSLALHPKFSGCVGTMGGGSSSFAMLAMAMVLMMMTTSAASDEQPEMCNLKTLLPCLKSVKGPYPPTPEQSCCVVVKEYNPECICTQFVDSKDYPQNYIKNVLAIPKACGRYQLSGYKCGGMQALKEIGTFSQSCF